MTASGPIPRRLWAGIDGGQSSTVAAILDEGGAVIGRGTAGPSDEVDEPPDSRRCADACESAVRMALEAAGLPPQTPLQGVVIGLSGYEGSLSGMPPRFGAAPVRIVHDAPVALAGAVRERPAALVIAGTGSVGYAEDAAGRAFWVGGYGYLFGDEGSAFAIARQAVSTAMQRADRGSASTLGAAALEFFGEPDLRALARAFYARTVGRAALASFARVVLARCRAGDHEAEVLVERAASDLARLAALAVRRVDDRARPVPVAFTGGVFADAEFAQRTIASLRIGMPHAVVVVPQADPAVGAARLAREGA